MTDNSNFRGMLGTSVNDRDDVPWDRIEIEIRKIARIVLHSLPLMEGDLDDLVQEVILRFLVDSSLRARVAQMDAATPYVATMLRNAAVSLLRRRLRHKRFADLEAVAPSTDDTERMHAELTVREVLLRLPSEDLHLIKLRFEQQLTLQEIAQSQGLTISAIAHRLMRILTNIRKLVESPTVPDSE